MWYAGPTGRPPVRPWTGGPPTWNSAAFDRVRRAGMALRGMLATAEEVTASQREAMFALMDRHYAGVRRDVFEADLAEKQWVILVYGAGGLTLRGFSTQLLLRAEVAGRDVTALFSGDTIIDRDHWGDPALSHVWGNLALS